MNIGFTGLGNVGAKLAGSLPRNGFAVTMRDIDKAAAESLIARGAAWADSGKALAETSEVTVRG
ncbi:MAG: NAD(P)-binding domain-containing protein [Hyphomicrobiaceae bacterium]